eukprot:447895-Amphidinium_carterae.1
MTCARFLVAVVCPRLTAPATLELGDVCANSSDCLACSTCLEVPGGLPGVSTCHVQGLRRDRPPNPQ